ncbi:MAG: lytic transglycosylase F, partial [Alphaproteobacteria bacterium]|nr:lytic transglycosylase F [Alphaproteobacteria bacterium]
MRLPLFLLFALVSSLLAADSVAQSAPSGPGTRPLRSLPLDTRPWTGDFDAMIERRMIRVLVPHSRTLFFNDRGQERGLTAELVRDFERHVNRRLRTGKRPITVYLIPTTRDRLLPAVAEGLGDIAAGNLTITPERERLVDFHKSDRPGDMHEIVLSGPNSAPVATLEDLSGRTVHVRPSSSYHESLVALNARFAAAGRPPARIVPVSDALEDEDMIEMLGAGLLSLIVVDAWKARLWARAVPGIRLHEEVALRTDGKTGWAVRKGSPQLIEAIDEFVRNNVVKTAAYDSRLAAYQRRARQLRDPTASEDWKRFEDTLHLFEQYGPRYGFEPLLLMAQGYQESRLDQNIRSPVGAIGVMQLMPATGAQMRVGDIRMVEANVHAGAKYMDTLVTRYFPDANFTDANRTLFAFAAYNAGPGRIVQMRRRAAQRGLDPDKWFDNVE